MPTVVCGDNTGDDYSGTDDTTIASAAATTNYEDSSNNLTINYWNGSDEIGGLIRFTGMSSIPSSATVSAASLNLYRYEGSQSTADTLTTKQVLRDWVASEATWNIWKTGNSWTTPGCRSDGNDRASSASDTFTTEASNGYKNVASASQFVQDVQDIVDGTDANEGWQPEITTTNAGQYRRYNDDNDTDGQRPYLSVTYTAAGGANPKGPLGMPLHGPFGGPI